ncbi:DUF1569 domain-containing protein [Mucilaginibacter sp. McL0603]|uniref:DUF1569 domain-containing protein n=1 Tax=Mucilaginibacter sp. McL0603 TaxID=3415670 RepID=UPI003CEF7BB4
MKTIFDKPTRDELIARMNTLNEHSTPEWGKMTAYQMVKHCTQWEQMIAGEIPCKRSFIGRIFGKMALKDFMKADKPIMRNAPTAPELKVTETNGDIAAQKVKWIALFEKNAQSSTRYFVHPFFGKMTREQIGCLAYRHIDHHLRQFNS